MVCRNIERRASKYRLIKTRISNCGAINTPKVSYTRLRRFIGQKHNGISRERPRASLVKGVNTWHAPFTISNETKEEKNFMRKIRKMFRKIKKRKINVCRGFVNVLNKRYGKGGITL